MKRVILLLGFLLSAMHSQANESVDERLAGLGISLVEKGAPTANYVYAVKSGNLLFTAGHIPLDEQGQVMTGKLGDDLTTQEGAAAARQAGISLLSTIAEHVGGLDKVVRIVKVTGMVNATADYTEHSQVVNGFSDLMVEVFGEKGKHARSAVGMSSLPLNSAVEIEVIVEFE
ncbi:RidA family protein [Alteromonas sp. KUL49]|uniref:RidA family protein n=1 Tax=Alteromonas sp. KUL49 TaxID=2480798 RepID=UPI00102F2BD5|nr:RidA family protein [Alteromonas sp. KUL49]TAP42371.1 RidA family protein [Alteromonas sp. KUL49]GEA09988.1 hypothetical protein KUL49_03630 [Alteromonas sp. KUL49]